jgi:hypothetical protein
MRAPNANLNRVTISCRLTSTVTGAVQAARRLDCVRVDWVVSCHSLSHARRNFLVLSSQKKNDPLLSNL